MRGHAGGDGKKEDGNAHDGTYTTAPEAATHRRTRARWPRSRIIVFAKCAHNMKRRLHTRPRTARCRDTNALLGAAIGFAAGVCWCLFVNEIGGAIPTSRQGDCPPCHDHDGRTPPIITRAAASPTLDEADGGDECRICLEELHSCTINRYSADWVERHDAACLADVRRLQARHDSAEDFSRTCRVARPWAGFSFPRIALQIHDRATSKTWSASCATCGATSTS